MARISFFSAQISIKFSTFFIETEIGFSTNKCTPEFANANPISILVLAAPERIAISGLNFIAYSTLVKCQLYPRFESSICRVVRIAISAFGNKFLAIPKCLMPALPAPLINIFLIITFSIQNLSV